MCSSAIGLPLLDDRPYVPKHHIEPGQVLHLVSESFPPCSPEALCTRQEARAWIVPVPCPMAGRESLERHGRVSQGEPNIEQVSVFVALIEHVPLASEDVGERKHGENTVVGEIRVMSPAPRRNPRATMKVLDGAVAASPRGRP